VITAVWMRVYYRLAEDSVQEQKESEENNKVPFPPQRSASQDAIPIKTLWVAAAV